METNIDSTKDSVRPYDDSIWENDTMYDNMPYVWNNDLTSDRILRLVSGNIIKARRCNLQEPYELKHE